MIVSNITSILSKMDLISQSRSSISWFRCNTFCCWLLSEGRLVLKRLNKHTRSQTISLNSNSAIQCKSHSSFWKPKPSQFVQMVPQVWSIIIHNSINIACDSIEALENVSDIFLRYISAKTILNYWSCFMEIVRKIDLFKIWIHPVIHHFITPYRS